MKLLKKAYIVDVDQLEDGYMYSSSVVHAKDRNEAKKKLLTEFCDCKIMYGGDVTYLNIPVIRYKEGDIVDFLGKNLTRDQVIRFIDLGVCSVTVGHLVK